MFRVNDVSYCDKQITRLEREASFNVEKARKIMIFFKSRPDLQLWENQNVEAPISNNKFRLSQFSSVFLIKTKNRK
jgi:hypothetical protein